LSLRSGFTLGSGAPSRLARDDWSLCRQLIEGGAGVGVNSVFSCEGLPTTNGYIGIAWLDFHDVGTPPDSFRCHDRGA
jgi:hypothetical protein